MKRSLCLLLITGIVLLTGCELPIKDIPSNEENKIDEEITMDIQESELTDKENENKEDNVKLPEKPTIPVVLYYQDADGYIIPVTRRITKQEGIARAAVSGLIDSSLSREEIEYYGLYPVLPEGTQILGLTIRDGTAIIDFNKEFLNYENEVSEISMVSSVVYTLTQFGTVKNVRILVNGYEQEKLKFGTDISGLLSRSNVLINSGRINLDKGMSKFDAYYLRSSGDKFTYILPASVEDSGVKPENLPARIVENLVQGYQDEGLLTELPEGVKLLGASVKSTTVTLDFNSELKNYGGTARENAILNQILFSMKQIEGISDVKLRINGKQDVLPEGTDLSANIKIPDNVNDYIDK